MASIKAYTARNGVETWRVRYRLQGRSCSKTFTDQQGAEVFGEMVDRWGPAQALAFIKEPTTPRVKEVTVAECLEEYVALRQGATKVGYQKQIRLHINPTLGDIPISKLTPEAVQLWVFSLELSPGTVRLAHVILSAALNRAVALGQIQKNPAAKMSKTNPTGVRLPRHQRVSEPVFLTGEEYERVLEAIPDYYKLMVEFLYVTGCRIGECLALTPADVNMRTGKVKFNETLTVDDDEQLIVGPTKTESSVREIGVPRHVLERLDLSGEFVFPGKDGKVLNPKTFRTGPWWRAMQKAGLPAHRTPRIHDLRHTHASWLLDSGVSIHAVQKRLGHSDVMTTLRIYGHAAADSEELIMRVLGD